MSFLSAALMSTLAPLVALPLIIHLLNKGFPAQFSFPSVRLIKETLERRSMLHRWRHLILLLLRTAFLVLLLLAFLQPVLRRFATPLEAIGARHVLIVLDHSVSMEHRGDGPSSRERAVREAGRLLETLDARDVVNVVLLDENPSACFLEFSRDHAAADRFLKTLKPGLGRGDVNGATAFAARLLAKASTRPELYYISDFQRRNWANADFSALPPRVKLFFIQVGPRHVGNHAILDARLGRNRLLAGETVPIEVLVGNFAPEPLRGRLTAVVDERLSLDQDIDIEPWATGRISLPVPAGGPGLHLCEVRLPPDALPYDDRFYLALPVQEQEEVLIVTDDPDELTSGTYFLKTALNPYENQSGSLLPRVIQSADLTPARLGGVRKMFFSHLNPLSDQTCSDVAKYLFQGGGLVYFLDGSAETGNLDRLEAQLGPGTLPLRLSERRTATNVVSGAQQVVRGDFRSPYLKMFDGPARQDLSLLEFYDYYQGSDTGVGGVLLTYGDDSPAMAVAHHGLGTLLLLNFSAGELSSNLARQRLFPAWMQELVKVMSSAEPPATAHVVGETLRTEVWRSELRDYGFRDPAGGPVAVQSHAVGERYTVTFTLDQVGFYTLGSPRAIYAFGVNVSPDEADLRPIEPSVLPDEFAADRDAHLISGLEAYEELARGRPIFHWFLMGALAVLVLESMFQFLLAKVAS